jgi:hypothetical protein
MYDPNRVPLTPQQLNQPEVRPWLKAVLAVILALFGAMYAFSSVKLFSAKTIAITACPSGRKLTSQLFCELGNLLLTPIPAQYRGIYEGVLHLLVGAALVVGALLLLKSPRK